MKLLCILWLKHEIYTIISTYPDFFFNCEGKLDSMTSRGHRHRKVKTVIREAKNGENCVLPYL